MRSHSVGIAVRRKNGGTPVLCTSANWRGGQLIIMTRVSPLRSVSSTELYQVSRCDIVVTNVSLGAKRVPGTYLVPGWYLLTGTELRGLALQSCVIDFSKMRFSQ